MSNKPRKPRPVQGRPNLGPGAAPGRSTPGRPAATGATSKTRQATGGATRSRGSSLFRQPTPVGVGLVICAIVGAVALAIITARGGPSATPATSGPAAQVPASAPAGVVVQGSGGTWTNVTPDRLAEMLTRKDFVLLNVKTPYIGEIDGTDLYIPYDQLGARASELPAAKGTKILVYCRSGVESAIAAQTLVSLGYTNVWNLDGGMNAWTASGRALVNRNR